MLIYEASQNTPQPGTSAYKQGQEQAEYNDEQYHYLCAAIQAKYRLLDGIRSSSPAALFPRNGLSFALYKTRRLKDIEGIKLHPRDDGTVHPGDIEIYQDLWRRDWKHVQGGILYTMGSDPRGFWNCIFNYCSKARTTGNRKWDALFAKLKKNGFKKDCISCAFYNKESGCLDVSCPFLHDKEQADRARARILSRRRKTMAEPTQKQRLKYMRAKRQWEGGNSAADLLADDEDEDEGKNEGEDNYFGAEDKDEDDEALVPNPLYDPNTKMFCSNPDCNLAWLKDDEGKPLRKCGKCGWAFYCSRECQVADWKRHKKEPCAPVEEIILDDDLWDVDIRKGTGMFSG